LNPYAPTGHRDDPVNIHDGIIVRGFVFPTKSGCVSFSRAEPLAHLPAMGGRVMHRGAARTIDERCAQLLRPLIRDQTCFRAARSRKFGEKW
jgi:hypothetical protein